MVITSADSRLVARLQFASKAAAIFVLGVGLLVIVGWELHIELLQRFVIGVETTKFNTAIALVLSSMALLCLKNHRQIAVVCAALVTLIGLLTASEYLFGWQLGIDQFFVQSGLDNFQNLAPGRMSPITTINFCLIGGSLLLLSQPKMRTRKAQWLSLAAGMIALLALAGYAYGVQPLYRISQFSSIALQTAISFLILSLGILCAYPQSGIAALLVDVGEGGVLIRRLLPAAVIIPLIFAWIRLKGQQAGLYDTEFGLALFALSNVVVISALIFRGARKLHIVDVERNDALHALQQSHDLLEQRVKERTAELNAERDLLRLIIDNSPDYIFLKDTNSRFILVNQAVLTSAHMAQNGDVVGKTDFDYFPHEIADSFYRDEQEVIQTGQPLINKEELSVDPSTGQMQWFSTSKVPIRNEDTMITRVLGISRNITERKHSEQQSRELKKEQERSKMLSDFVRDMSHDFRTPISVIRTSLYLISKVADPEKQKRHLDKAEQEAVTLTQLVDRLLLMVRLDSQLESDFQIMNINLLVSEVCGKISPQAEEAGATIDTSLSEKPLMVEANYADLCLALTELGQNAVKYGSPPTSISLRTRCEGSMVVIEVKDTGVGIAETDLPHLFERLYRVDKARSTTNGGAGLGLPIARRIVELHHGEITVESKLGEGSTFRI